MAACLASSREGCTDTCRSTEVPFFALFDGQHSSQPESVGQTMHRGAPHGKSVQRIGMFTNHPEPVGGWSGNSKLKIQN
jgi:hypothetical protein